MKTKYICKCGRVVEKSTTADNTGNRDTAGCEGCPYLLPWGPFTFGTQEDGTQGYRRDIQGYECWMSHTINYASEYRGQARDKCTLRIASLDLDFLDEIQSWIYDNAADTLRADFSRGSMRGTDFSNQGRYSLSISCAQNKQGMAAKAALIERFFAPSKKRKGKTADQEKAIVLAAIEEGKATYQRKKENMEYIISENLENDCVYAYAANEFWVYDKQACRWYTSGFCREQYEQAKLQYPFLTPEDFLEDDNDYNLLDDYEIPRAALDALLEAVKGEKREAAPFEDTNPTDAADDASPCAPTVSDAPPSPSQSAAADAQQGANDDLSEVCRGCRCAICGNKDCPTPCFQRVDDVQECKKLGPMGDDCEDYQPKEDEMQTDDHGIMTDAGELLPNGTECRRHAVSRARTEMGKVQAIHVCDDQPEGVKIWLNACEPAEYWVLSKAGEIEGEHIESCPYCAVLLKIGCGDVLLMPINREPKSNKPSEPADSEGSPRPNPGDVYRSAKGGRLYKIGEHSDGKKTYYRTMRYDTHSCTWAPANGSLYPELSNAQGEFEAWIRTEQLEPVAPNGAAAAITAANAATKPSRVAETTTTSENGADVSGFPNALTAPQPAEGCADIATNAPSSMPTFDYSGLDDQTVADLHLAEREVRNGRKMAEMGLQRMADGVAIAHDTLCGSCDKLSQLKHGNRGENTFGAWCESLGLHRKAAYRLLQVSRLFDDSTPREQKALRELTNSVLYEASRPSAEPEAVEALKRQQVKTLKEFRALEAQIKAERQAREKAEHDAQRYREDSEKAREAAHTYHCQYEQVNDQRNALLDQQGEYAARVVDAEQRAKEAEERARAAQSGQAQQLADAKKQWQAAADREKQAAVDAAIEQARTDARASAAVDVLFDQLENTVAALQAALETLEGTDADKAAKLRRSLARLLQTLAAQMGVG